MAYTTADVKTMLVGPDEGLLRQRKKQTFINN